jgi:hypothetical protein
VYKRKKLIDAITAARTRKTAPIHSGLTEHACKVVHSLCLSSIENVRIVAEKQQIELNQGMEGAK